MANSPIVSAVVVDDNLVITYADGTTQTVTNDAGVALSSLVGPQGPTGLTGPTGPSGADGRTWYSGTGAPSSGLGANNDYYLDTAASAYYGPKTSGAWGSAHSIVGATGAAGATGATGSAGAAGSTGATGSAGAAGATGATGPAGPLDAIALVKSMTSKIFQAHPASLNTTSSVGVADIDGWAPNGTKSLVRDALGPRHDYATAAAQAASAYISTGIDGFTPRYGSGMAIKMAMTAVADGRAGFWISNNNSGINELTNSSGIFFSNVGCGIGYDKNLGHTTWQFHSRSSGANAGTFVDSLVAIQANVPLIFVIDASDKVLVTMTIMDVSGTVLATYTLPSTGAASLDATLNYWQAAGCHTGNTGSPAARSFQWWFLNEWRQL